jgi:hypothetical protein
MSEEPQIVKDNKGDGTWIDFWVICDTTDTGGDHFLWLSYSLPMHGQR